MCHYIPYADGLGTNITFRTWNPHGPDQMEVLSWTLVERSTSKAQQRANCKSTLQNFGSSGMIEQEDAEAWPSLTRNARGHWGKQQWLRYPARHKPGKPEGWPGGGLIYSGISKDDNQWNWWTSYYEFLTNTAWDAESGT
jgi:hypothetical protein